MSEVDDLGLDDILDDEPETEEDLTKFYSENEAGEVMFDPERVVSDEEAAAALVDEPLASDVDDVPVPEAVGEVTQARIDPNTMPAMTPIQKREARRAEVRERQIAADKQRRKEVAEANARKVLEDEDEKPEQE